MNKKLLNILACPVCKARLIYNESDDVLICKFDHLAFPLRDGVPVMLESQAKKINS